MSKLKKKDLEEAIRIYSVTQLTKMNAVTVIYRNLTFKEIVKTLLEDNDNSVEAAIDEIKYSDCELVKRGDTYTYYL